eukprot:1290710-Rhodomonas_salina.3
MDALKMWTEDGEAHFDPLVRRSDAAWRRWTYKQLQRHVDAFANGILDMQFKPQHKIVMWAKDTCESVVAQMGCLKAGVQRIYSGTMVSCIVADAQMEVLDAAATESDLKAALDGARLFLISPNVLPNQVWKPISRLICPCAAMLGANISRAVLADEHDDALQADPGAGGVRPVHGADSHERGFPDAPLGSDARAICIVSLRLLSFRSQVVTMGFEKHEGML